MNAPPSKASVTIAYNAASSLPRQLEALLGQTNSLEEIIVVDNASTDGTSAMLAACYPQVTVLHMPQNVGAAGAWAAGLKYAALERGHDWVWTFDDDSVPTACALESLLSGFQDLNGTADEVGMLVPIPVHSESGAKYPPTFWREGFLRPSAEQMKDPVWFADLAIASGSLLKGQVVKEIGIPRADFFMDIFDFEYCLRMRGHGYKIAAINKAEMSHEIGSTRKIDLPGYKRLWMNQPPWREYYIGRNLAYLAWQLYPSKATKVAMLRYLVIHLAGVLCFSTKGVSCAWHLIRGIKDGLQCKMGIRIRPMGATVELRSPDVYTDAHVPRS